MSSNTSALGDTPENWWSTSIIEMKPGMIRYRGYAVEELIGRVGFAEVVYLMTRGELPHPACAKLLEAALVAAVDHGPQAPSIAAARMAITCGVSGHPVRSRLRASLSPSRSACAAVARPGG